jgi:hypothetical protein
MLLEYPTAWRHRAIEDSKLLSDQLKNHIRQLEQRGAIDRPLLVRRAHRRSGPLNCFFIRSCEDRPSISRVLLPDYEELLRIQPGGEPVDGLMYAVCTHGRHDQCCAKFGLPVYCALRDVIGERVWECSHVGGDRFAGNVVVFPYGIYYGRVAPEDVSEIVRLSELGQVWLRGYRGRSCFPRPVQVAEYFARCESGRLDIDEFRLIEFQRHVDGATQVRFEAQDTTHHVVEFQPRAEHLAQRLTCKSLEISPVRQYELTRYLVTSP